MNWTGKDTALAVIIGVLITAVVGLNMYSEGHENAYRDAIREIPLYHQVTGEYPDLEWGMRMRHATLETRQDIIDMYYPYGEIDNLPNER
ncbi:hypothetical protein LCGC14_0925350 [marine sediment metagenome]|uniref:Uncharacterized protein n=1 Tax=marine sediment metagenome TaxID=412755 RepID=A0A0F9NUF3_9ZZZZ